MIPADRVSGMILTGGSSSRMGSDKALLAFGETIFVRQIAASLSEVLSSVSIVSDQSDRHTRLGIPVIHDRYQKCGPLGGIHAALDASVTPYAVIVACDTPFLTPRLIRHLLDTAQPETITICNDDTGPHPLTGVYPVSVLPALRTALDAGVRRVMEFLDGTGYRAVNVPEPENTLHNINTPEAYRHAIRASGTSIH